MLRDLLIAKTEREGVVYAASDAMSFLIQRGRHLPKLLQRKRRIAAYLAEHDNVRIAFGAGGNPVPGFLNTDALGAVPVDITTRLPFDDAVADLTYSNHVVEHIYNFQFKKFLAQTHRILKPGGLHVIATPTLERLFHNIYEDPEARAQITEHHSKIAGRALSTAEVVNGVIHVHFGHKFLHDAASIEREAKLAGYTGFEIVPNRQTPDPQLNEVLAARTPFWDMVTQTFVLTR